MDNVLARTTGSDSIENMNCIHALGALLKIVAAHIAHYLGVI